MKEEYGINVGWEQADELTREVLSELTIEDGYIPQEVVDAARTLFEWYSMPNADKPWEE